ncbi:MAG TPA: DUF2726 domain-containing protein [Arsenophonus nasoniae]|uniref:DUF2726 domain-containing protein n=1 Tax=Arsenophonus nasoniae TaxID=638 RepID=UPI0038796043
MNEYQSPSNSMLSGLMIPVIIFISFSIILIFILRLKQKNQHATALNYELVSSLMTNAELAFYKVLCDAVVGKYLIIVKVRMADVIMVKRGDKNYMSLFGKIKSKHIDYLLCDPLTLKPVLAIELDDKSHRKDKRIERDKFINEVFSIVGLPILRQPCRRAYKRNELMLNIQNLLEIKK